MRLRAWERASFEVNTHMLFMSVTLDVSHPLSGLSWLFPVSPLLKTMAALNMPFIPVTSPGEHVARVRIRAGECTSGEFKYIPVFQLLMSWLKALALLNIETMSVTLDVSHPLSGLSPLFPVSPLLKA